MAAPAQAARAVAERSAPERSAPAIDKRTMLGMPGTGGAAAGRAEPSAGRAGEAAQTAKTPFSLGGAAGAKAPVPQKTMMGMTSPFVTGSSSAQGAQAEPARPATGAGSAPAAPAAQDAKRTMLGVAPPVAGAQALRGQAQPMRPANANADAKRTMVGVAPPDPRAAAASARSAPGAAAAGEPAAPAVARKVSAQSDRTMLGMPTAVASVPTGAGGPDLVAGGPPERPSDAAEFSEPDGYDDEPPAPSAPSALRAILAALAGALVVLAAGLGAWYFLRGPAIALRVVSGEQGEQLEVHVPDAAPGARVRFLGAEQELRGGVARFPLAADALALGNNELAIGIVRGGSVESASVQLQVAYRARVDLAPLAQDPPALAVVIEALPGSKVLVDGQPAALDERGRATKLYPLGAEPGTKLAFSARYRVEPKSGAASEGELRLNLPVTSLQIDRPGPSVTTDQNEIEVAGAVESGAAVTIDGQAAKVHDGRFLHRVRLPKAGEYAIHVVSRAPGKVPRALDVKVTRVADLSAAASSFEADPALTYARIAQNPVIYRGQKVAFEGRVYNVEVKGGVSHLQMLVRDCPGTQRCPLWVEVPEATDVVVDTWVRVLGTVAGEQQFRSERGQVHTVPSVNAQYVLKLPR